jgi:hypothetical protein
MNRTLTAAFVLAALGPACSSQTSPSGTGGTGAGTSGGTAGKVGSGGTATTTGGTGGTGGSVSAGGSGGSVSAGGAGGSVSAGGSGGSVSAGGAGGSVSAGGSAQGGTGVTAGSGGTGTGVGGGSSGMGGSMTAGGGAGMGAGGSVAGSGMTGGQGQGGSTSSVCPALPTAPIASSSIVQLNDNGGWCWYQDERAVVDTKANKVVIGSVAFGGNRDGNIEAVIYDIASGKAGSPAKLGNISVDDHNAPGIVITPSGNYMAMYAGHRVDCYSRYTVYNGTSWSAEKKFDWSPDGCPWAGASTNMITYANPWYMGSTIYSMVRSVGTDPGVLSSTDDGASFSYYGRLMSTTQKGYVAGYFKYWGDNTGRVDFVGTEAHPRDFDTSLYHGYISNGMVYDSTGKVMDASLHDSSSTQTTSVDITGFTPVLKTGTSLSGTPLCRLWNHDIMRYADGTIAVLGQGRANSCTSTPSGSDPDKRMFYSRFDGTSWKSTYLVKAGSHLYSDEEDYTGLSALDPDDPHIIYVSSTYDPRDDKTTTPKHELYEGVTCDNGATWKWTPLTQNSSVDNLRPIVPKWDASHKALLWMQGTYTSAQSMNMKIVGVIGNR